MAVHLEASLIDEAIQQAAQWQDRANRLITYRERARQARLGRLLDSPTDRVLLVKLLDQSLRSRDPARVADQINHLLKRYGVPRFLTDIEKGLMLLFREVGPYLPQLAVPRMIATLRDNSRHLILAGEAETLREFLTQRRDQGIQVNLNRLGEAVLGEAEAQRRLEKYTTDLQNPLIEHVSIKISSIYSQLHPLAFEYDVEILKQRLSTLYEAAHQHRFVRSDGTTVAKTVHLDMESYGDVAATLAAFRHTLDQPAFQPVTAGIVLQAYLPESYTAQQALTRWARQRVAAGGAPVRLRIVKGANLEMERIDAALNGWPLAPYDNKPDVDANFKRMLLYGLAPEHVQAVRLGVASHNLFELALAHRVAQANGVLPLMTIEMLTGMADHVGRAIAAMGCPLLLYAPVAGRDEFLHAIAYLIRRMDENTGEGNFLRHAPDLETRSDTWQRLAGAFKAACNRIDALDEQPHRSQNRLTEAPSVSDLSPEAPFRNEPDTDWSLAANRQWAGQIRARWCKTTDDPPIPIVAVVAGSPLAQPLAPAMKIIFDINQLPRQVAVAQYHPAQADEIRRAVAAARRDPDGWRALPPAARRAVLARVAGELRRARGDLIGAAAAETGKVFAQADPEVSEAIDFAEYYPRAMDAFAARGHLKLRGKGVGLVVSPWNFPIAIPCGGICAALAAGNTVILKPASAAVLTAWCLCQCFWRAGVSRNTLQFVPCAAEAADQHLINDPAVDFVILTGGTETARAMLRRRPELALSAETGGKNATIVTAMADRDQAIKHVIHSAFGHCGQKCSATSLLILEQEVYDDPQFKRALVDAARSLAVGSAWQFESRLGPLIQPPGEVLRRGLTQLEPGESWALKPDTIDGHPHLWTPGIKWDVPAGGFTHMTELFGPVLAVMRAENLAKALELAHQTGYGLTAGIESLDPREIEQWRETMRAGNLYINRGTTGAIVLRQPFGGWGRSAVGPAIKAGGPHYVAQFVDFEETAPPPAGVIRQAHPLLALAQRWESKCRWGQMTGLSSQIQRITRAIRSYLHHAQNHFEPPHDPVHLRGEENQLRHRPVGTVAIGVHPADTLFEVAARAAAGRIAGNRILVCLPAELDNDITAFLQTTEGRLLTRGMKVLRLSQAQLAQRVAKVDRLRYAAPERVPPAIFAAAAEAAVYIARAPVLMDGGVELLHYYLNQTVSHAYHRAGNLGERASLLI